MAHAQFYSLARFESDTGKYAPMGLSRDLVYFATQDNIARQHEERISLHQFNENSPPETPERIRLRQIFNKVRVLKSSTCDIV